ncbi:cation:proton antiporter [Mycoplasmatota bacterium WC44]
MSVLMIQYLALFFEQLTTNIIFNIALLLTVGIIGGKIAEKLRLPKATGYILIGMLTGPYVLNYLSEDVINNFKSFKILALGFMGYKIGMEVNFVSLRKFGKSIFLITVSQAIFTFILVSLAVWLVVDEHKLTYGLIFGAIATVTTPAPIIACIKSYHIKGRLSDFLCPMIAIDVALGILIFAFVLPLSIYFAGHDVGVISLSSILIGPFLEIGLSLLLGSIIGIGLVYLLNKFKNGDNISLLLIVIIGLFFGISIGYTAHISATLLPLTIGVIVANKLDPEFMVKVKSNTDSIILPILLVFFTLSGAQLNITLLPTLGGLGLIYIFTRTIGKISGASLSAKALNESKEVVSYLGITLVPQGSVAIDMAILVEIRFLQLAKEINNVDFEVIGSTILSVILATTVIYKMFGEIMVKWAFKKAGEIPKKNVEYHKQRVV